VKYAIRYTRIEYPTLAHFRHFSSLFTNFPSTTVESALQINSFYAKQSQFPKSPNERKYDASVKSVFCQKNIITHC